MDESSVRLPVLKSALITRRDREVAVHLGGHQHVLQGRDAHTVVTQILPRLDGVKTREDVIADITRTDKTLEAWSIQALDWLVATGMCVVDREHPGEEAFRQHYLTQIAHFGQHVTSPTDCQRRLQQSRVAVIGVEYIGSLLLQQLAAAGVGHLRAVGAAPWSSAETPFVGHRTNSTGDPSRHTLLASQAQALGFDTTYEGIAIVPGDPLDWDAVLADCHLLALILPRQLPTLLRAANHACLSRNIPFLPVWMEPAGAQIGPLVVSHRTPCWVCYELRHGTSFTLEDIRTLDCPEAATMLAWDDAAMLIPWGAAVAAITACEIVTALAQYRQPTSFGHVLCLEAQTWRLQPTPVLKLPRCPACSPLRQRPSPQPFTLPVQEDTDDDA